MSVGVNAPRPPSDSHLPWPLLARGVFVGLGVTVSLWALLTARLRNLSFHPGLSPAGGPHVKSPLRSRFWKAHCDAAGRLCAGSRCTESDSGGFTRGRQPPVRGSTAGERRGLPWQRRSGVPLLPLAQPQHPQIWPIGALTARLPGEHPRPRNHLGVLLGLTQASWWGHFQPVPALVVAFSTGDSTQLLSPFVGWKEPPELYTNYLHCEKTVTGKAQSWARAGSVWLPNLRSQPPSSSIPASHSATHTRDSRVPWMEKNQGDMAQCRLDTRSGPFLTEREELGETARGTQC